MILQNWKHLLVTEYLESHDDEQSTTNELIDIMKTYLSGDIQPYGFTHMKSSIQEHFKENILITEINGESNVVTFRHTAASIITDFYEQPHSDDSYSEKIKIIRTAAKLLKSEIKSVNQGNNEYPYTTEMSSVGECINYLSESLHILLQSLFVGKDTRKKSPPLDKQ